MANNQTLGRVKIEHEVIAAISASAAGKVKGVSRIIPGLVGLIEGLFGRTVPRHAVRVRVKEQKVSVDLALEVVYGSDIPQLSWEVQKSVKQAVEGMTGMKVARVGVDVRGLSLPRSEER